ncbi:MAG: UDP-N-acetylglucosamine 1-carboxyvinyltransferase [Gammaproteobacteria bacterium]
MRKLKITGGKPLSGEVSICGAKNAALPALFACLLTDEQCRIDNIPQLRDIDSALAVLAAVGAEVDRQGDSVRICAASLTATSAPYELVKTMRASVLALGPLLARAKEARVSLPGGCVIGARPVDMHMDGFAKMGADVKIHRGDIVAQADKLQGAIIRLPFPTVTGTENLMMAAALADGKTIIENAAREPEIIDLAVMLNAMGADISGAGESAISINGVSKLGGAHHRVMPDRIEAGTYLCAAAACGGEVFLHNAQLRHLSALADKLQECGAMVQDGKDGADGIGITMRGRPQAADIATAPYPGYPTDLQAQWLALSCIAKGRAAITETIFENRFMHVPELARMGADIELRGNTAIVGGAEYLSGARVMATDIRASAALVVAALAARGDTIIDRIYHLQRGYGRMTQKLGALGASVQLV